MVKVKSNYKLVRDFIIPSLENKTYGSYMTWEDKIKGSFKISRIHQNNEHFSQDCIEVYKDWSLRRNLWIAKDPKKITKAKHRLVTALRRSPEIEVLDKESSYYRFRFIGSNSLSQESSNCPSKFDCVKGFEDKEENENIVLHIDLKNDSQNCLFNDNIKNSNRGESKYKLSEELCRPSVVLKRSEELEIEPVQDDQTLPLADNLINTSEDNGSMLNDKCGCVVLLDSYYLCNKRCIWHGNFP